MKFAYAVGLASGIFMSLANAGMMVAGTITNFEMADDFTFGVQITAANNADAKCNVSGWYYVMLNKFPAVNGSIIYNGQVAAAMTAFTSGSPVTLRAPGNVCAYDGAIKYVTVIATNN